NKEWTTMQLTQAQVNFFNTFGYLAIRQLFTPDEVAKITAGFEWSIQNRGGGQNHDGSKRTMFGGPIEHTPEMCAILDHPGILGLIGGVIGFVGSQFVLKLIADSGLIPYAEFHLNHRFFIYGLLTALFFGLFSGVYPAWKMSRLHPVQALKGTTK
ncbi:MAG TPA: hypothetical protein PLD20_34455, partial [Blastocatellia bacterium]|nr:hypothetical protein [Blastocatellia bacterium]